MTTLISDRRQEAGFTLVEMIVAVGLFTVVMLISLAALLALVDANRKARAIESVMNNLNIALDGMVRNMRMGSEYHCGAGDVTQTQDCATVPGSSVAFLRFGGTSGNVDDYFIYSFNPTSRRLERKEGVNATAYAVTAPEIEIDDLKFYVIGTTPGDGSQPKIVIVMKGTVGADRVRTRTTFSIQATAVQRVLDI
jgi:type II secretory pathway pseudopilin PulG